MNEIKLKVGRFLDNGKETLSNISLVEFNAILFSCVGIELPWKNNEHNISCIRTGIFDCIKVPATANIPYEHILILNVPGRDGCCIHKVNFVSQLRGCIGVGDKHVDINGDNQLDVTNSSNTYNVLMRLLPKEFKLEITDSNNLS